MHDASALMRQNDEDERQTIRDGGKDEEVDCNDLPEMIGEKCPPRLARWSSVSTVAWLMSMPSFRSSPWILGTPHNGLASAIVRINERTS